MRIINRTIYGSALQTAGLFNIPLLVKQFTTLNEKFGVLEANELSVGELPDVKYYCIGNKGHTVTVGADNNPYTSPVNHNSSDAALYNHLPFVLRLVDNDLTVTERLNYSLRKEIVVDGTTYIAYYLKRLDLTPVSQRLLHSNVLNGNTTTTDFIPTEANLNPLHPTIPNSGVITTDGNYLSTSTIITIDFNEKDVEELLNVSNILYGNPDQAVVSEIGICSGVDRVHTVDSPNGTITYNEAAVVQIATFITGYYPVGYSNRGFELSIEAGATEPLLTTEVVTTTTTTQTVVG